MNRVRYEVFVLCAALSVACACTSSRQEPETVDDDEGIEESSAVLLRFGVPARPDPRMTYAGSQPLVDYLQESTAYRVEPRVGRSVELTEVEPGVQDLVTYLEERLAEVAPLGALSYCVADQRFGALPLVKSLNPEGEALERSVFITNGELSSLADLEGKRIALGPTHSALGSLVPRHELGKAGVSPEIVHLNDDRSVIDAVKRGEIAAGAVAEWALEEASPDALKVFHISEPIASRPLVVREDLPQPVRDALLDALLRLVPETAGEREDWDPLFRFGFVAASRSDYEVVRRMMDQHIETCSQACH